jgi:hypothetical protein
MTYERYITELTVLLSAHQRCLDEGDGTAVTHYAAKIRVLKWEWERTLKREGR